MKKNSYQKTILIAAVMALSSTGALAEYNYHESYGFEDEIKQCVEIIRPVLGINSTEKVVYDVQEIDLQGPWYRFEITAVIVDEAGIVQLDGFNFGCKSNRWIESASLLDRRNSLETDQIVMARSDRANDQAVMALNVTSR